MTTYDPSAPTSTAGPLEVLRLPTPAGTISILSTPEDGVVRVAGFADADDMAARLPAVLRLRGTATGARSGAIVEAVAAYSDGDLAALDAVPVDQPGGPFVTQVLARMRAVPAGTTVTYGELAALAGRPAASRAAGTACARNLIALFVPCHRIMRAGGSLGGYYYGLTVKERLLAHERGA